MVRMARVTQMHFELWVEEVEVGHDSLAKTLLLHGLS